MSKPSLVFGEQMRILSTNNYSNNQIYPQKKYNYSNVKFEAKLTLNKKAASKLDKFFKNTIYYILMGVFATCALKNAYKEMVAGASKEKQSTQVVIDASPNNKSKNTLLNDYNFFDYKKLNEEQIAKKDSFLLF